MRSFKLLCVGLVVLASACTDLPTTAPEQYSGADAAASAVALQSHATSSLSTSTSQLTVRIRQYGPTYGSSYYLKSKQTCTWLPHIWDSNGTYIPAENMAEIYWGAWSSVFNYSGAPNSGTGITFNIGSGRYGMNVWVRDQYGRTGQASLESFTTDYNGSVCSGPL